ncbi:hypothetical protein EPN44_10910 [bacterium]|nr:MAG: hypothetical protein EPN44_10910 [bacterium]
MGTLKFKCVWRHRFQTFDEASSVITAWARHYSERRLHSALGYITPAAWRQRQTEKLDQVTA